jgi:hypothetical protein
MGLRLVSLSTDCLPTMWSRVPLLHARKNVNFEASCLHVP